MLQTRLVAGGKEPALLDAPHATVLAPVVDGGGTTVNPFIRHALALVKHF